MRILAELPHPDCKISIFGMNQKFIIKFEQGTLEQSFKISEMDVLNGVNGVFELLDETFIQQVLQNFNTMRKDFIDAYNRVNG
ncbi:hypothetical protein G5B00_12395 [Parapedobacter sp. SGR-10]|uniref:hypothetical protein n=1 Tax=Parapedobacter sp. SGR-10 TaxID=2710879 RepID=UPI0013D30D11|nr:hypothetical protein [Parapedobacter sp. SGR-10]NGF57310.1 hypothetical protein [Parapedobacter sp. SGR-10]